VLGIGTTYSQNYFEAYNGYVEKFKGKELEIKVDGLLVLCKKNDSITTYVKIAHKFAIYQVMNHGDFSKALQYSLLEVEILENFKIRDQTYSDALYVAGRLFYNNSEYENAILQFKKVIDLNNYKRKVGQAYTEIGNCYDELGDFFKSIEHYKKGIIILKELKEYESLFTQYLNFAVVYKHINTKKSIKNGLNLLKKAEGLLKIAKLSKIDAMDLVDAFANLYATDEHYNFEKAKFYYFKNLKDGLAIKDSALVAATYNNIANLFTIVKKDSAKYYVDKGLLYVKERKINARLYDNECEYYINKNRHKKALTSIHKALEINLNLKIPINRAPNKYQLSTSGFKYYTMYCLKKKTEVLIKLYNQEKNTTYLKTAIAYAKAADILTEIILESIGEDKTNLFWRKEASEAYLKGVYAAKILNDPSTAFYFMEKNKALMLTASIAKNTGQSNLPKNVSEIENRLKSILLHVENKASKKQNLVRKSTLLDSLLIVKESYAKFIDSIRPIYPEYFNKELNVDGISLEEYQSKMNESSVVVSYIWNNLDKYEEVLLGLLITKNHAITFRVDTVENLKQDLIKYRNLISRPLNTVEELQVFKTISYQLYQQLFPTEEIRNLIAGNDLTVIPDGALQNIPFEALITKEKSVEYLLQSSRISYAYSMSFLSYNKKVKRNSKNNFVGYSPTLFTNDSLSKLKNTKDEIVAIEKIVSGNIRINGDATKEHFLTSSNDARIIHLATHADASKNPWIAFSDGKLELHELYTYKNNADLVVLSACNTTLGKVAKGEGVLSLARGFFYSGANSVVSSLWNVNDVATSSIMTDFYKNLKAGESKSVALNNAKLKYIEEHSLSETSPYYWASFILIGDTAPMELSNSYENLYLIGLIVAFFLVFYFFKRKFKF